jgi:hypothetical protein
VQVGHVVRRGQDGVAANGLHYAYVEYRTDATRHVRSTASSLQYESEAKPGTESTPLTRSGSHNNSASAFRLVPDGGM